MQNSELVDTLISEDKLRIQRGRLFDCDPEQIWRHRARQMADAGPGAEADAGPEVRAGAKPETQADASPEARADASPKARADASPKAQAQLVEWDRVEGMMLGLAIGDSLGNTTESMLPHERRARYGEVRDYLEHRGAGAAAVPSDDTQLAFWTLEQLIRDKTVVPDHLAARFASKKIFGIGSAVKGSLQAWKAGKRPWYECSSRSAGNGALMRIAPVLIPHLSHPSRELWADTALAAAVTHNDATSTAACLAFVAMLWELLVMDSPPEPTWWPERFVELTRDLEGEARLHLRGGSAAGYEGPLWRFIESNVPQAYADGLDVLGACDIWFSGAFLLETVPSALFILMRHAADPEEAIVRAVNDTKDNDTIAAIVGAAIGALHGKSGLPERWLTGLKGRTGSYDDGRVYQILDRAHDVLAPTTPVVRPTG